MLTIDDLAAAPWNPRSIDEASLAALGASERAFGDISGIVFNDQLGVVVCGHQRLRKLREDHGDGLNLVDTDGRLEVVTPTGQTWPVRRVQWDEATSKAANVAANSPMLMGEFTVDVEALVREVEAELPDLSEALRLAEIEVPTIDDPKSGLSDPDAVPETPSEAVTRRGDLWLLGRWVKCPKCGRRHYLDQV